MKKKMFEYVIFHITYDTSDEFVQALNEHGKNGWEVAHVFNPSANLVRDDKALSCLVLFKREV